MSLGKSILSGLGVELDDAADKASPPINQTLHAMTQNVSVPPPRAAVDQASVDALNKQIFAVPDNYTLFRELHQALGGDDVSHTLSILTKANPSVSVRKIKNDIQMALDRVKQQRQQFDQEIDKAKKSRVDDTDAEIKRLMEKIASDNQQIVQLQSDIAASQQQVAANQSRKHQAQVAIDDGKARFESAVQAIEEPLQHAQTIFSNIQ